MSDALPRNGLSAIHLSPAATFNTRRSSAKSRCTAAKSDQVRSAQMESASGIEHSTGSESDRLDPERSDGCGLIGAHA
jgi:hypothetical protein